MGKTRLSWGEGIYFNGGDVLFDSTDLSLDLTSETFREDGAWLAAVNIPLGPFAFLETAVLPPIPEIGSYPSVQDTTAGIRGFFKPGPLQVEVGYAYRGAVDVHRPYIAIQGNVFFDFNLSAAGAFPTSGASWESLYNTFHLTFGLFHLFSFPAGHTLSLRLEGLIRPDGSWRADALPMPPEEYAFLFYPEIIYAPVSSLSLLLRSVVSPVDLSALITVGVDWHITQGLHFLTYFVVNAGEEEDLFPTESPGGFAATCGFRLKS